MDDDEATGTNDDIDRSRDDGENWLAALAFRLVTRAPVSDGS